MKNVKGFFSAHEKTVKNVKGFFSAHGKTVKNVKGLSMLMRKQ